MRSLGLLALGVAVALLVLGCNAGRSQRVGTPWPTVRFLLDRNRARIEQDPHAPLLPTREEWQRLHLEFFKGGGVALYWDRGGIGSPAGPLVFGEDGTYLCSPVRYAPIDVTGDGVRDLVTTEWIGAEVGFRVYDLAKRPVSRVTLGSMCKYSFSQRLHPAFWDADHDGVFEIICLLPVVGLASDCHLEISKLKGTGVDGLITVWSFLGGTPRIVLAIGTLPFRGPDEFLVSGLWLGAPGEDPSQEVTWDSATGSFRVPDIDGIRVFVNRSMHPKADGARSE